MGSSGKEVREYIIWAYSFLSYWPSTHSRPLGNDACLLLFFEIIINEVIFSHGELSPHRIISHGELSPHRSF